LELNLSVAYTLITICSRKTSGTQERSNPAANPVTNCIQSTPTHPINPFNAELHPICHLLALLGAHLNFHVSRIRVKYHFNIVLPSASRSKNVSFLHTNLLQYLRRFYVEDDCYNLPRNAATFFLTTGCCILDNVI